VVPERRPLPLDAVEAVDPDIVDGVADEARVEGGAVEGGAVDGISHADGSL
jgi:hypothetical protein